MILILTAAALAGYLLIALAVGHHLTRARRVRPAHPPLPLQSRFHRVTFEARGERVRLAAWYGRSVTSVGAVVLVHGRDACRGDELRGPTFELACDFMDAGLSVVMVDLRGHGESDDARLTFGLRERHDVLGAVDFLLARGYRSTSIGVFGASMGGVSAIGAAADEQAIGAIIADSAFHDLGDVVHRSFTRLTYLPRPFLAGVAVVARGLTGEHLMRHTLELDIQKLIGRPTLIIHAESDPLVPVTHAVALARGSAGELWITGGSRHLGSYGMGRDAYRDRVVGFFASHLLRRTAAA